MVKYQLKINNEEINSTVLTVNFQELTLGNNIN